jgi:hypothetical protein
MGRCHLAAAVVFVFAWCIAAAPAGAVEIVTFYDDLNSSGDYDFGEERTGGVGGDGGSTFAWAFDLDAVTEIISSTEITIVLNTYDHNFGVDVNGVAVVPVDPSHPAAFTPAVTMPWNANVNGLPRLVISLSETAISFDGTEDFSSSTSLTLGLVYAQPTINPIFVDGQNTITITNVDGVGADGIDFTISGSVTLVPEPGSLSLVAAGLLVLTWKSRRPRRT